MANPFDSDDGEILEGFLCPICREDLKTPERLTAHVETVHEEEQDLLKSLKDIYSKAKRRIKSNFDETIDLAKSFDTTLKPSGSSSGSFPPQVNVFTFMPQNVGVDCDHLSYFNSIRTPRLKRYATETNKLIIRLNKILEGRPTDPVQRKIHEQKMVTWLDGKSVNLCPSCAKNFNFTRRQHHCRLCGSIMCNDCSRFLKENDAIILVNLTTIQINENEMQNKEDLNSIRTCDHCQRLLEARKEMQDSRTCRPPVTLYYAKIKELQKDITPDIQMYSKMIKNLYEGDSIFTVSDASALRGKIGHVAEHIDGISKAIMALPCLQGSREEALKKSVRLACVKYIKEEMLSIPPLPVEGEIKKLQDKRRRETEQRIQRERRLAEEAYERYGLVANVSTASSVKDNYASGVRAHFHICCIILIAVTTLDNWSGYQSAAGAINDPLVEQINIIKGYIKQARAALRFEEVAILEKNLRELQQEFYQRYQQN